MKTKLSELFQTTHGLNAQYFENYHGESPYFYFLFLMWRESILASLYVWHAFKKSAYEKILCANVLKTSYLLHFKQGFDEFKTPARTPINNVRLNVSWLESSKTWYISALGKFNACWKGNMRTFSDAMTTNNMHEKFAYPSVFKEACN